MESPNDPGTVIEVALTSDVQAQVGTLQAELDAVAGISPEALLAKRKVQFATSLGYDPKTAKNLDLIQASKLELTAAELEKLGTQGFAISRGKRFMNMAEGLKTIYAEDLPVYISLDPILDAVHTSYDGMLKQIEVQALIPSLQTLLETVRARNVNQTAVDARVRADLDLYFGVAQGLLEGAAPEPLAGADAAAMANLIQRANAASGIMKATLFGVDRNLDFSQFKPRGHYTDSPELSRYFRAMIWLGRTDFRLIETQPNGSRVFHRRQFEAMLGLRELVRGEAAEAYEEIDAVVTAFVGVHDYMRLEEIDALLADLNATTLADTKTWSDKDLAQRILNGGYGTQRIASQVVFREPQTNAITLPLDRSFALLGQRYIVDSQVFSDVVYDRVLPKDGTNFRFLPDPLDAAYAVLGNPAALPLLEPQLERYGYAPQLERARTMIDAHGADYWDQDLYTLWLSALRAASPPQGEQTEPGMPAVTRTEPWARRVLNTQLGSWAQLRHDTILYAKQSYSGSPVCEFPDAYVDPYPEAFERIADFAARGRALSPVLGRVASSVLVDRIESYYRELESVANILRDMAAQQKQGVPFNAVQMAFVNDAVKSQVFGCGGPPTYEGWYARIMFGRTDEEMDPTIADVHTDPGGTHPPHVLHVATGYPRLMVVTVDTCNGPRAYAGLTFAYHELVAEGLIRYTDEEWASMADDAALAPWLTPVLD